jgi:Ca-activated chloride channel family protein
MKIDANDPRWTAYALGELKNEQDRAEIEETLFQSEEARRLIEEIQATAQLLAKELQNEPSEGLLPQQRQRVEAKIGAGRRWLSFHNPWVLAGIASAATLLLVVLATGHRMYWPASGTLGPATANESIGASVTPRQAPASSRTAAPQQPAVQRQSVPSKGWTAEARRAVPTVASAQPSPVSQNPPIGQLRDATGKPSFQIITSLNPPVAQSQAKNAVKNAPPATDAPVSQSPAMNVVIDGISTTPPSIVGRAGAALGGVAGGAIGGSIPVTVQANAERLSATAANVGQGYGAGYGPGRGGGVVGGGGGGRGAGVVNPAWRGGIPVWRYPWLRRPSSNTEAYDLIADNPFLEVAQNPLSTFSIDVDTASYSNVRRFLNSGALPPKDAVRIEELINYFDYEYAGPADGKPLTAHFDVTDAPWKPEHRLLRVALKGRELRGDRPASNLVFLLDVSGSMGEPNKLPLVKESMRMLVNQLTENDKVAIVVYATEASMYLPPVSGDQKSRIMNAIDGLQAGGSTNGGSGIQLAYQAAQAGFIRGGINRIILATDGDFNVGITNRGDLTRLIEDKAKSGIFLTTLGFGMGNYKDATLESLADKGNGNYAYIDTPDEARKVFVEQLNATLVTIAKDVKIQIEFNPAQVSSYRLIGYEDRQLAKEDFNNDAKDAGEVGAGHAVTVLYELVPANTADSTPRVDPLKYQQPTPTTPAARSGELATLKVRYKEPDQDKSISSEYVIRDAGSRFAAATADFKFAAAVAAFGMVLRESPHKGNATLGSALEWATSGQGADRYGYRQEFIRLVQRATRIPR